jgi:hypothetical protein
VCMRSKSRPTCLGLKRKKHKFACLFHLSLTEMDDNSYVLVLFFHKCINDTSST